MHSLLLLLFLRWQLLLLEFGFVITLLICGVEDGRQRGLLLKELFVLVDAAQINLLLLLLFSSFCMVGRRKLSAHVPVSEALHATLLL